uniref:Uncharacterized protein n=1 Tax=Arion vulgaris TaxID=1028688 RepID=A0A0B7A6X5_9EUPU
MSCGSSCSCHFKWLTDTQGSKRDPINSEKAWLDFTVRLLSREVVGKGKGQETVWSERCKPQWWDKEVDVPWKNPTSNPKDTKEVLLKKYTALERKLREEGRFPQELEEEAKLWSEGKYRELFLQTSLVSLLGKVTGVHLAINDAFEKVKELKAQVNESLVNDLQHCLLATLKVTENLQIGGSTSNKAIKRPSPSKDNIEVVPEKQKKFDKSILISEIKQKTHPIAPYPFETSQEMLNYDQEIMSKSKCQTRAARTIKKSEQKLQPKPSSAASTGMTTGVVDIGQFNLQPVVSSNNITLSPEELSHLLLGKLIVCSKPDIINGLKCSMTPIPSSSTLIANPLNAASAITKLASTASSITKLGSTASTVRKLAHHSPNNINHDLKSCKIVENESTDVSCDSDISYYHHRPMFQNKHNPDIPEIDFLLSQTEKLSSDVSMNQNISEDSFPSYNTNNMSVLIDDTNIAIATTTSSPFGTQTSSDRMDSFATTSDSEPEQNWSDTDYSSKRRVLDLDDIYSNDEQNQLWKEDGSYLLDRFLDDLDASEQDSMTEFYQ